MATIKLIPLTVPEARRAYEIAKQDEMDARAKMIQCGARPGMLAWQMRQDAWRLRKAILEQATEDLKRARTLAPCPN